MKTLSCWRSNKGVGTAQRFYASPKGPDPWEAGPPGPVTLDHEGNRKG